MKKNWKTRGILISVRSMNYKEARGSKFIIN